MYIIRYIEEENNQFFSIYATTSETLFSIVSLFENSISIKRYQVTIDGTIVTNTDVGWKKLTFKKWVNDLWKK